MVYCSSPEVFNNSKEELFNIILLLGLFKRHILLYNQLLLYPVLYMHFHSIPITNFILVMQRTINNLRLKGKLRAGIFHFYSRDRRYTARMSTQVIFVCVNSANCFSKCIQKAPGRFYTRRKFHFYGKYAKPTPRNWNMSRFQFRPFSFHKIGVSQDEFSAEALSKSE